MVTKSTKLQDLRQGRIFVYAGKRYKLLYHNACRALIQPLEKESVVIGGHTFRASRKPYNVTPSLVVEVKSAHL